jgi:uncharacterized protein (DUF58 family)
LTVPGFVDVVTLGAVQSLGLRARLVVEGLFAGLHRSPFKGFSVEFSEYRAYQPGDDPRLIDWRAFARTDRYYVKEYQEETNLRFYLCLDASASMAYAGAGALTKFEYAAVCAAALAYLALTQRDAVGLFTFGGGLREVVPPRSNRQHFKSLLQVLERTRPRGDTDLFEALASFSEHAPRRGLFAVFSDLWDEPERVLDGLRALRAEKHEVIVFHILDDVEANFPFRTPASFVDLESVEAVALDSPRFRESYAAALAGVRKEYDLALGARDIDYVPATTDVSPAEVLVSYLGRRRKMM